MSSITEKFVSEVLETIPVKHRGPGGAVAVVKDGELLGQRVWGYADLRKRIPMTNETLLPICSITKQFVGALVIDLEHNPPPSMTAKGDVRKQLSDALKELLSPELAQNDELTIQRLLDMQSGLRDYWAMTTLWGAQVDDEFRLDRDAAAAVARTKSLHFQPGTEFSYCNINFYLVARAIERATGESLGKLLEDRILRPAGMTTAALYPDTAQLPPPCIGYEGNEQDGYVEAINRMEWSGDAGLVASLTDMIAYEKYLDRLHADETSWYRKAIEPQTFLDGTRARYHYGLGGVNVNGVEIYGHNGGLRGFRLHRRHAPREHLSIVVLFNHEANSSAAGNDIMRGILKVSEPQNLLIKPAEEWYGVFLEEDTQLAITVKKASQEGQVSICYDGSYGDITLSDAKKGDSRAEVAEIDGDTLRIHRIGDHRKLNAKRLVSIESVGKNPGLVGEYHCAEIDSTFHCEGEGSMLYGSFNGYLGKGPAHLMRYLGGNVWALACPRGLDAPAPGDWTMVLDHDEQGITTGFTIGCWLARRLRFVRST